MANEESGSPLRRWRPFYGAFSAIDGAIEADGHPRSAFREVRSRIVVLLRNAADDGVAEQLCAALDDAMVEALQTLRVAPVRHSALASSSTDLASAVGALGNHGSARIRSLAEDVVRGWRAADCIDKLPVSGDVDRIARQGIFTVAVDGNAHESVAHAAAAAVEVHKKKLYKPPAKMLHIATAIATEEHKKKLHRPPAKMISTRATVSSRRNTSEPKKVVVAQSEKMETTKRKLREGYQEAERVKRQHTIQKINDKEAAKMLEQKQRKIHRIVRGRGPATCRISTGVRRSLLPSQKMI